MVSIHPTASKKEFVGLAARIVLGIALGILTWAIIHPGPSQPQQAKTKPVQIAKTVTTTSPEVDPEIIEQLIEAAQRAQDQAAAAATSGPQTAAMAASAPPAATPVPGAPPPATPSAPAAQPTLPTSFDPNGMAIYQQALETAQRYNIPPNIFFALIQQESKWDYRARSRVGAIGLTQVMPDTAVEMGYAVEQIKLSTGDQLEAGAKYLSQQFASFGRWDFALAAYNAGPNAVAKYGGIPPYAETQNYVRRILSMAGISPS